MNTQLRKQIRRSFLLIAACFLTNLTSFAQWGQAYDSVSIGNVNARFYSDGTMFHDKTTFLPKFEVPKGSGKHTMYAGGLWVGGLDASSQLHMAAQTYNQAGRDFWPGPAGTSVPLQVSNPTDSTYLASFDKVWKITRAEIDAFIADFNANQSISNPALYPNVFNWPAFTVDPYNNRHDLAPFYDVDGDPNNYTPSAGDYPVIHGDEMLFWVYNDGAAAHTESGGLPFGFEFHGFAYAYDCPNGGAADNTVFLKIKMINRSSVNYTDLYSGYWSDADLGNFSDDYVGTDSALNLTFTYNGDADDNGNAGYGTFPPSQGVTMLRGPEGSNGPLPMTNSFYYENNFTVTGNPTLPQHFYGYLSGFWKDNTPLVNNGGNGYGAGPVANYYFPGDPGFCGVAFNGWNEVSAANTPGDRRILQSAGPYDFASGASMEIEYAMVYARGNYNDNLGSVCELKAEVATLNTLYAQNSGFCISNDSVWPGDANYDLVADVFDLLPIGFAYGASGPVRANASIAWAAQAAFPWNLQIPGGNDYMHADCEGDGVISDPDTLAIQQNYGLTHNKGGGFSRGRINDPPLLLEFDQDTFMTGDTVVAWLIYGDSLYPADSVLSLAARFSYDPGLVDTNSISISYPSSWLGTRGNDLLTLSHDDYENGLFDVALCRTDRVHVGGYGRLARVSFITIDNISTKLSSGVFEPLSFRLLRYDIHDQNLNLRPANPKMDSLIVNDPDVSRDKPQPFTGTINVWPNPAKDQINVRYQEGFLRKIDLINSLGQTVRTKNELMQGEISFPTSNLPRGIYFLSIQTDQGSVISKIILD